MRRYVLTGALGTLILLVGFWLGQQASAQGNPQPGSPQDPIVTESYVTQAIATALSGQVTPMVNQALQTAITQQVTPLVNQSLQTAITQQVTPLVNQSLQTAITQQITPLVQSTVQSDLSKLPQGQTLSVVTILKGEELVAQQGTEVILRSGGASVYLPPTAAGGFADLTGGKNIGQGQPVPANHLLLAARSDGRSIVPKAASCLMIVIGSYTVQPVN